MTVLLHNPAKSAVLEQLLSKTQKSASAYRKRISKRSTDMISMKNAAQKMMTATVTIMDADVVVDVVVMEMTTTNQ